MKELIGSMKGVAAAALMMAFALGASAGPSEDSVASVTTNGVTLVFETIEDAWEAASLGSAENPATLKLLQDVEISDYLCPEENTYMTFDLNDHVVRAAADTTACYLFWNTSANAHLTFVDTAATKTKKYFTQQENGLWVLTNEVTALSVAGGIITGAKCTPFVSNVGNLTIRDISFVGNTGSTGGAIYLYEDANNLYNVRFYGNVSTGDGGAILGSTSARILLDGCDIRANVAAGNGGGVCMPGGSAMVGLNDQCVLVSTVVANNRAGENGGGVYFEKGVPYLCLAAGTLVTLADGSAKAIEDIAEGAFVRAFDHVGGTNAAARVYCAYKGETAAVPLTLTFDAGTLSIVGRHDLLLKDTRKYVTITAANAGQYVGAQFYGADGAWHTLTGVRQETKAVAYYSLYSAQYQNIYANGMLTVADDVDYVLNIYALDENLKADAAQLAADVAHYGYLTYETAETYGLNRAWYADTNAKYLRIAVGKQLVSWAYLRELFASTPKTETTPTTAKASPLNTLASPRVAAASLLGAETERKIADYDGFGLGVLVLGENVAVTNNFVGESPDNIYLTHVSETDRSLIALTESHAGVFAGVATSLGLGQFTADSNVSDSDVSLFTSDNDDFAVRYDAAGYLTLGYSGVQTGDDVWAKIVNGVCTVRGTGDMWDANEWTNGNPLADYTRAVTNVVIDAGVTSVGAHCFDGFRTLRDVTLGADCTCIGEQAFLECWRLTNVVSTAAAMDVGAHAFYSCNSLEAMAFGANPTFGEQAFALQAGIYMKDGLPVVYAIPAITIEGYRQVLKGSNDLANWETVTDTTKGNYHFFKILLEEAAE